MPAPARGRGGVRNLLAWLALLAIWAWPARPTQVEVTQAGDALVVRLPGPPGDPPSLELAASQLHPEPGAGAQVGSWVFRGLPGDPAEAVLRVGGRRWDLGPLVAAPSALQIAGVTASREVRLRVRRRVLAWWKEAPSHSAELAPGDAALRAPEVAAPWTLVWEEAGLTWSQPWDPRRELTSLGQDLFEAAEPGEDLVPQEGLWRSQPEILRGPDPTRTLEAWFPEVLAGFQNPGQGRRLWNRLGQWKLLGALAGTRAAGGCGPAGRRAWQAGRSLELPDEGQAVPLPDASVLPVAASLIQETSMGVILAPPGPVSKRIYHTWPERLPPGAGPLRLELRVRGVEDRWLRIVEARVDGDGYRVSYPPSGCPGGSEWIWFTFEERLAPIAGETIYLEVRGPQARSVLREIQVRRLPALPERMQSQG